MSEETIGQKLNVFVTQQGEQIEKLEAELKEAQKCRDQFYADHTNAVEQLLASEAENQRLRNLLRQVYDHIVKYRNAEKSAISYNDSSVIILEIQKELEQNDESK